MAKNTISFEEWKRRAEAVRQGGTMQSQRSQDGTTGSRTGSMSYDEWKRRAEAARAGRNPFTIEEPNYGATPRQDLFSKPSVSKAPQAAPIEFNSRSGEQRDMTASRWPKTAQTPDVVPNTQRGGKSMDQDDSWTRWLEQEIINRDAGNGSVSRNSGKGPQDPQGIPIPPNTDGLDKSKAGSWEEWIVGDKGTQTPEIPNQMIKSGEFGSAGRVGGRGVLVPGMMGKTAEGIPGIWSGIKRGTVTDNTSITGENATDSEDVSEEDMLALEALMNGGINPTSTERLPFPEASKLQIMSDPNSWYNRDKAELAALMPEINRLYTVIQDEDLGSWVTGMTEEQRKPFGIEQAAADVAKRERARQLGLFNGGSDYTLYNAFGRMMEARELKRKIREEQWKLKRIEKGRQPYDTEGGDDAFDRQKAADLAFAVGDTELKREISDWLDAMETHEQGTFEYEYAKSQLEDMDQFKAALDFITKRNRSGMWRTDEDNTEGEPVIREAYDAINGEGAYERRIEGMSEIERRILDRGILDVIGDSDITNKPAAINRSQLLIDYYRGRVKELDRLTEEEGKYPAMEGAPEGEVTLPEEYDRGSTNLSEMRNAPNNSTVGDIGRIISLINRGNEFTTLMESRTAKSFFVSNDYRGAMMMTPEEIRYITQLYLTDVQGGKDPTQAEAFLEALQPTLNARFRLYEESYNRAGARQFPIISSLDSAASTVLLAPALFTATVAGKATGADWVNDPYSTGFAATRFSSDIESQVAKDVGGGTAGKLYQAGLSAVKNILRVGLASATGGGSARAKEIITLAGFFAEDFNATYQQRLQQTRDPEASAKYAFVDGMIATLFETASVDKLYSGNPASKWWWFMTTQGAIEASEELNESVFGETLHQIFDGSNKWTERAAEILAAGGFTDEKGNWVPVNEGEEAKAFQQAAAEHADEAFTAMWSAFISAFGSTGGTMVNQSYQDFRLGTQIWNNSQNAQSEQGEQREQSAVDRFLGREQTGLAEQIEADRAQGTEETRTESRKRSMPWKGRGKNAESGNVRAEDQNKTELSNKERSAINLIESAEKMGRGTESNKEAQKLLKKIQQGKNISAREVGKLARTIITESNQSIEGIVRDTVENIVRQDLRSAGVAEEDIGKLSEAFQRGLIDRNLGRADAALIGENEKAAALWQTYNTERSADIEYEIRKRTETTRQIRDSVEAMITPESDGRNRYEELTRDAQTASTEELEEAEGERTGHAVEAVADGKISDITGISFEERTITEQDENGEEKTQKVVVPTVTLQDGRTVDAVEVRAVNRNVAQVLEMARQDQGRTISTELFSTLLREAENTQDMARTIADAMKISWAVSMETQVPVTRLSADLHREIMQQAQQEKAKAEGRLQTGFREMRPGEGSTSFDGAEYGTQEFKEKLKNNKISRQIRNEAMVIGSINRSIGGKVELYYDEKDTGNQGVFYSGADGKIRVNLAGTSTTEGRHRNAVATFAHEMTHYLAANSKQAYGRLRSFVLQNARWMGINVQNELTRIMETYARHGENLTVYDAIEELIAKASEQVLTDEKVVQRIKENDPNLHGKLKQTVNELLGRLLGRGVKTKSGERSVGMATDIFETSSIISQEMYRLRSEIGKAWSLALEEAQGERRTETETESRGQNSFSDIQRAIQGTTEKQATRILKESGEIAYAPAQYSFAGPSAAKEFASDVIRAGEMARNGATEEEIRKETNCVKGYNGRYWRVLDNNNMRLTLDLNSVKEGEIYFLREIYDAEELYRAYPWIRTGAKVVFNELTSNAFAEFHVDRDMIAINTKYLSRGAEAIEADLQHEIQHFIQVLERSYKGSNTTFWAQMQDIARARLTMNAKILERIHERYGIDSETELEYGIEFNEDGSVNEQWLTPEEIKKVNSMPVDVLLTYRNAERDNEKWLKLLKGNRTAGSLYRDTVGEIEARAASEKTTENTRIHYPEGTVAVEDYTGMPVAQWSIQELDEEYAAAVKRKDWRTAEDMLLEKMQRTPGITGYRAAHFYNGEHKVIAKMIKENYGDAIATAVEEMAPLIPENAALVPMPPHEGKVLDDTDTMILARALGEATGRPVIVALESDAHKSRNQAKKTGDRSVTAESMGFRQTAEIPEDMMPVFVDNMVGGGTTAIAAKNAIGRGITLAYGQSARAKSMGVKDVSVTYDKKGKLIPLSQRMDPNNKSWKYSVRDDNYKRLVENGDMETAQWMVDMKAEAELERSKVRGADGNLLRMYHGTKAQFNEFKRDKIGSTGRFEGSGFNFTPYEQRAASYGGNVLSGYLNIENPLSAEKKTISVQKLAKIIRETDPTGNNIISNYARETRDYGSATFIQRESLTAARQIWVYSENDVDIYSEISSADPDAEGLIAAFEKLGYDGLIHYDDDGNIKTCIAFNSNQFKRADTVTYDDQGEMIPLSERFNANKQDIRYSFIGIDQESGDSIYLSNYAEGTPKTTKQKDFLQNIQNVFSKKAIKLELQGFDGKGKRTIYASFDPTFDETGGMKTDAGKLAYNKKVKSNPEDRVRLNLAGDLLQIIGESTNYNSMPDFRGRPEILSWHYFNDDIYYVKQGSDIMEPYKIDVSIKEKQDGNFVYTYEAIRDDSRQEKKLSVMETVSSVNTGETSESASAFKSSIAEEDKNNKSVISLQEGEIRNADGELLAEELPGDSYVKFSRQSWENDDVEELARQLVARGFEEERVDKWIHDVNGIAKMIADNRDTLDYEASPYFTMLKNNQEYVKTLDASTLCPKRLLYQGIYNEIQHLLPNTPIMPDDLINLINMMKKSGVVTPCGLCYVESRRRMLGKYAQQWLNSYEGEYKPRIEEVTTTDGLEALRENHPQTYQDFVDAMNAKGSANPKVVQMRTDYRQEIRNMTEGQIRKVKEIGGLRVQSFSDFEIVHMIDMMQAVMDMAAKELTSQAYTKVPEFAWVFGDTGIKINLSLIGEGTGLDENGNLIFSSTEGMDFEEAMAIRGAYSKNVGTILVGMNDEHVIVAMGDDRIDFIIPFHKSGWSKKEMARVSGMSAYKDFTRWQNEKKIAEITKDGKIKTIPNKKSKITNFEPVGPNGYWDFSKDGTSNAKRYLELCKQDGRVPKFANFLEYDGDGGFRLPTGDSQRAQNIRKGYWKLLIDFKMYDNEGNGAPQETVQPNFNMEKAREILSTYEGGANSLPTDHDIARKFVEEYKAAHPGRASYSFQDVTEMDVQSWMMSVNPNTLQTEAEKTLLRQYKDLQMRVGLKRMQERELREQIRTLEELLKKNQDSSRVQGGTETLENALEEAGATIRRDGKTSFVYKDGEAVAKLYGSSGIKFLQGISEGVKNEFELAGFKYNEKARAYFFRSDGRTAGTRDLERRLKGLRVRLENTTTVKEQTEEKLAQITSTEGYGRMMRDQNRIFNDFMYGRTQAEVQEAVERLEKGSREIAERIVENMKAVNEMEKSDAIRELKQKLGKTTVDQMVTELKNEFHSTWTKAELRAFVDPIIIKMSAGEDFDTDVQELADILISSDSRNTYEGLEALRGLRITIGHGAMNEIHARNSSLREYRARLAGTGITLRAAQKVNGHWEASTLESDVENLRQEFTEMPELGEEKDALENFTLWVENMKKRGNPETERFYAENLANAMATIMQKAAATANGIYIPSEARAQKQVLELVEFVKSLKARTEKAEKTLQDIALKSAALHKAGIQAAGMARALTDNVGEALQYYDRTAKLAIDQAKQKRQDATIEQLKSEHAQKILKINMEWRNLIERDNQARRQAENNAAERSQINTALKRMFRLLRDQKPTKNMPEYMQGLAREVLESFVDNDFGGGRKLMRADEKQLTEMKRLLTAWKEQNGPFSLADLDDAQSEEEAFIKSTVNQDLMAIYDGIEKWNGEFRGKNKLDTLKQRGEVLQQIQEAVGEIYSVIQAERTVQINRRKFFVEDLAADIREAIGGRKAREWKGVGSRAIRQLRSFIISGNMTPEYFFRTINNAGLSQLWEAYHEAENRNGLELARAQARLDEIAKEHGYDSWDMKEKLQVRFGSKTVEMTRGQLMSLWATWNREKTLGPAMSEHLSVGGFYAEQDLREGKMGKTTVEKKATRVHEEDIAGIEALLTDEQKAFVNDIVGFMSTDMSKLGNAASMAAYGIKMYKEAYYFPFQIWDGIRSRKSNDAGKGANADRAFHPSFSKTRLHGANNALVIGDFMTTAADHIAGMINYATMGLANETFQKVLNAQLQEDFGDEQTRRNIRTMLEEAYGMEAMQYLNELQMQLNGGAVKTKKSIGDKAISLFRKNAVAGSLSVAFQQPLSYIRAAMMINPKYLAKALAREYWKGSYQELLQHSGVAVIKNMGRFDMNFGQSAREFLMPEGMRGMAKKAWDAVVTASTFLPEKMDAWTWARMWVAVKAEQHDLHPEMDVKSDEFLDMCGTRFNDIMRRTQVYDSVLVKSANMRSDSYFMKGITSFMAEPTLTLNVLADAVRQVKNGEKGGMKAVATATSTFLLSAILQAAVKGAAGAGRNPDEKKNRLENFLYRFQSNLLNEINPISMIPGYSDLITILKDGKLNDDALGAVAKLWTASKGMFDFAVGNEERTWKSFEDSVGQIVQLVSGVPLKNIMRDARMMWNYFIKNPFADRETSTAVLKYQAADVLANADSLMGVLNKQLGEAGWVTNNTAYYQRIYEAKRAGNEQDAEEMEEYLITGKGVKPESVKSGVLSAARKDGDATAAETADFLAEEGGDAWGYVRDQLKSEEITAEEARELLAVVNPEKSAEDIWWTVDRIQFQIESGQEVSGKMYRLEQAISEGKDIRGTVDLLMSQGVSGDSIISTITDAFKDGNITGDKFGELLKVVKPDLTHDEIWWRTDRIEYQRTTGSDKTPSGYYYRLTDAVNNNSVKEIQDAVRMLMVHGVERDNIKKKLSDWKSEYLAADSRGRVRIRNAIQVAYKALGFSAADADKVIDKWK